jgi:hypothetical protein
MEDAIPAGFFADAVNPTDEEIVRWAYIPDANYPPEMSQDWDLCVTEPGRADLLERLASDPRCPNRKFFLSCLYLLIGDAVRSNGATWSLHDASVWLSRDRFAAPDDIAVFLQRAKRVIVNPKEFDYNKWCWSGHAYEIEEAQQAGTSNGG